MNWFKNGQGSILLRVFLPDSTVTTGAGKTGLGIASTGLIIGTISDNEASAIAYTALGSTIETIATLGTFAAPTATKCRFREVDATNFPGLYEIQIADARFAVSSAKALYIGIQASGVAPQFLKVMLSDLDPFAIVASVFRRQLAEAYAADGVAPTVEQALFAIIANLFEENISGTGVTWKKLDGATTAMGGTLNSATTPTGITRSS